MISQLFGSIWLSLFAIFVAAIIRGYGGFGFSLAAVPLLGASLPLSQVVPLALTLEMVGILPSITRVWRLTHWRELTYFLGASFAMAPLGMFVLHAIPSALLRPGLCIAVLVCVVCIWRPRLPAVAAENRLHAILAGGVSGFLNGAAAMSGPPIIVYFLGRRSLNQDAARATMMMFFSLGASATLAAGIYFHAYQSPPTPLLLASLAPLYAGIEVGTFLVSEHNPGVRRRIALLFLAGVASFGLFQSFTSYSLGN